MIICLQAIRLFKLSYWRWRLRDRSVELFKENEISKQNSLNVISNLSAQCWNVVFCVRVNLLQFIHFHNSILLNYSESFVYSSFQSKRRWRSVIFAIVQILKSWQSMHWKPCEWRKEGPWLLNKQNAGNKRKLFFGIQKIFLIDGKYSDNFCWW